MKFKHIFYLLFLTLSLISCSNNATSDGDEYTEEGYKDGTYCAEVTYSNSNTGTNSTYTLEVEVSNNEVIRIEWGNGGWLDEDHFTAQTLDETGYCSFTSDEGYDYTVQITGQDCSSTDVSSFENDREEEEEDNEEDDEAVPMLLSECAQALRLTENELRNYEKDFKVKRTDLINSDMCQIMSDYFIKIREINGNLNALNTEIDNGKIETVYAFSMHDEIVCHQIIAKKKGIYYWLQVNGSVKCKMGTIQFDSNISGWQEAMVKESPNSTKMNIYSMKIMGQGKSLFLLNEEMEKYCLGVI